MSDFMADWILQKKIYELITYNSALRRLFSSNIRLYDDVPENVVYPFITLGESKISSLPGIKYLFEHDIKIQIFSQYGGRKEVKQIMGIIQGILHEDTVSIETDMYINMSFIFGDIWQKSDRGVYRGVMKFRAVTHPIVEEAI